MIKIKLQEEISKIIQAQKITELESNSELRIHEDMKAADKKYAKGPFTHKKALKRRPY